MAEYRTIRVSFWNDPYIEELSHRDKLLYIYLFTCPHVNNLGVVEVSQKKIAFETGLPIHEVKDGLSRMREDGKVMLDGTTIWLVNFVKHQTTTSPKIIQSCKKLMSSLSSEIIKKELYLRYQHLFDGCDTKAIPTDTIAIPSDTLSIPYAELEGELEGELEEKTLAQPPAAVREFDEFWQAFPKKKSKGQAKRAWDKLRKEKKLPPLPTILQAIAAAKAGHDWQKDGGKYIPYPATWLNGEGWEDEPTQVAKASGGHPSWF